MDPFCEVSPFRPSGGYSHNILHIFLILSCNHLVRRLSLISRWTSREDHELELDPAPIAGGPSAPIIHPSPDEYLSKPWHTTRILSPPLAAFSVQVVSFFWGTTFSVQSLQMASSSTSTIEIEGSNFISSVAFLADGRHIVGGGFEGQVRRWRAEDGQEVGRPMNAGDSIVSLAVSRDGKWVVSGTESGRVTIWDAMTHSKVTEFRAHPDFPIEAVDVSPDVTRIATGAHDTTACAWSVSTGERLLGPLKHDFTLAAVKYSSDGCLLATATCEIHSIRIYDSQDGRLLLNVPVQVDAFDQSLLWSNDNKHLFALSDGKIKCLNVPTGTTLSEWPIHSSNDPRGITLARNGRFIAASANSSLSFWDTTTHGQIGPVIEHADVLFSMAISPNYDLVTSGVKSVVLRSLHDVLPSPYFDEASASMHSRISQREMAPK